jgi:two-component system OmpR family response regulator
VHHILLIDDDAHLGPRPNWRPTCNALRLEPAGGGAADRPSAGLARLAAGGIDAVILDVMLPEMDGFDRLPADPPGPATWRDVPVLMLTARGELSDRVVGLELGADDYLPKPFEPRELAARLQTILRRARPAAPAAAGKLQFDGLQIDLARRAVVCLGSRWS